MVDKKEVDKINLLVDTALRDITDAVKVIDPDRGFSSKGRGLSHFEEKLIRLLEDAATLLQKTEALIEREEDSCHTGAK